MISNTKLIQKNNGNIRKVNEERQNIVDTLKGALRSYFKGINLKATVSNYNNGDLRISVKKVNLKGYNLEKLFKSYGLKSNIVTESNNFITYCIYVFN
ncbi:MAG: hypothetical protein IKG40_03605 [Bacilli bacterium]|nr:hypothetical protein [Bacilli bacterium]